MTGQDDDNIRLMIASLAMQSCIQNPAGQDPRLVAKNALAFADALLEEHKKQLANAPPVGTVQTR